MAANTIPLIGEKIDMLHHTNRLLYQATTLVFIASLLDEFLTLDTEAIQTYFSAVVTLLNQVQDNLRSITDGL